MIAFTPYVEGRSICNAEDDGIDRCVQNNKNAGWDRFSHNQDNTDLGQ